VQNESRVTEKTFIGHSVKQPGLG